MITDNQKYPHSSVSADIKRPLLNFTVSKKSAECQIFDTFGQRAWNIEITNNNLEIDFYTDNNDLKKLIYSIEFESKNAQHCKITDHSTGESIYLLQKVGWTSKNVFDTPDGHTFYWKEPKTFDPSSLKYRLEYEGKLIGRLKVSGRTFTTGGGGITPFQGIGKLPGIHVGFFLNEEHANNYKWCWLTGYALYWHVVKYTMNSYF